MKTRKLPPDEQVAEMYLCGLSSSEIAEKYGVSDNPVLAALKRMNVPRRSNSEAQKMAYEMGRSQPYSHWTGKKLPSEMIEKVRANLPKGEEHWAWKGGKAKRDYRKAIAKEKCARCETTEKLGIHHKDNDHFNNNPENLEVLCNSCHMSEHKKAYWEARRAGQETPKSNGPVGWERQASPKDTQ